MSFYYDVMNDVTITLECNNQCIFCVKDVLRGVHVNSKELKQLLADSLDKKNLTLTGGEVTVYDDICALVTFCKEVGYENIGVITNGRRLGDASFLGELVGAGVNSIAITVYSVCARVHDSLTGVPGSCAETMQGVANALDHIKKNRHERLSLRVNILVNSRNTATLCKTIRSLYRSGVNNFLFLDIVGLETGELLVPYEKLIKLYISLANDRLLDKAMFTFRGYPPCIFIPFSSNENKTEGGFALRRNNSSCFRCEVQEFNTHATDDVRKAKDYQNNCRQLYRHIAKCRVCHFRGTCLGYQKKYLARFSPVNY